MNYIILIIIILFILFGILGKYFIIKENFINQSPIIIDEIYQNISPILTKKNYNNFLLNNDRYTVKKIMRTLNYPKKS